MAIFEAELLSEAQRAQGHATAALLAPAIVGMLATKFLFRPVIEKVTTPEQRAAASAAFPALMAELYVNGFNGVVAAMRAPEGGGDG